MALAPRVVVVTRPSPWQALVARHGTEAQTRFVLSDRDRDPEPLVAAHGRLLAAVRAVTTAIPLAWRRARVDRSELDRFLFEPEDVVVVVGQDGLVANVAKYLDGQLVIGIDGAPGDNPGVLVRHRAERAAELLEIAGTGRASQVEARTLAEATLDDGQVLRGLNEVFVGHRSHQSARYTLAADGDRERQSSSGVVVATGTGGTGWAASIVRQRATGAVSTLPSPTDDAVAWFVREPWPSPTTGCTLAEGRVDGGSAPLRMVSEMEDGGVVFADGIEDDHLVFERGRTLHVGPSSRRLHLLLG